jgi:hypothetical protein
MSQENPQSSIDRAMRDVRDMLEGGIPRRQIEEKLRQRGYDANTINAVVYHLQAKQQQIETTSNPYKQRAINDMGIGAGVFALGLLITVVTGLAVVAWGAILFGGWRFLRGLFTYFSS